MKNYIVFDTEGNHIFAQYLPNVMPVGEIPSGYVLVFAIAASSWYIPNRTNCMWTPVPHDYVPGEIKAKLLLLL